MSKKWLEIVVKWLKKRWTQNIAFNFRLTSYYSLSSTHKDFQTELMAHLLWFFWDRLFLQQLPDLLLKTTEPTRSTFWSYSNKQCTHLYSKKIEEKIAVLVQLLGSVEYIHLKLLQEKMGFHRFTKNFQPWLSIFSCWYNLILRIQSLICSKLFALNLNVDSQKYDSPMAWILQLA